MVLVLIFFLSFSNLYAKSCDLDKSIKKIAKSCKPKEIHLTYDDGPDIKVTPRIIHTLKKKGVDATFFISTDKLDPREVSNRDIQERKKILKMMTDNKFLIASHGHHHIAHDLRMNKEKTKCLEILSREESQKELLRSYELLNQNMDIDFESQSHVLVRFPYGRGAKHDKKELELINRFGSGDKACHQKKVFTYNQDEFRQNLKDYHNFESPTLQTVYAKGYTHVGWNYDSDDSGAAAHLTGKAYRNHIIKGFCNENGPKKLMALFHDNLKPQNAQVLEEVIDISRCLGMKFVSYDEIQDGNYLVNYGTLQKPPTPKKQMMAFQDQSQKGYSLSLTQKMKCRGDCKEDIPDIDKKCWSNYLKQKLSHCLGTKSICFFGKFKNKKEIDYDLYCSSKTCKSSNGKYYTQCGGESSICINGKWYVKSKSRNTPVDKLIEKVCRI